MKLSNAIFLFLALLLFPASVQAGEYNLVIARERVNVTGHPVEKLTINGSIPGPVLHFIEGESVTVHVMNRLDEPTSIHWHGFLIPAEMDGVPGFNGFPGIMPGETFTYRFHVRQSGTYWYHAHSQFQEQDGLYGGIVIAPKDKDPVQSDRDYMIVLSDFTAESGHDIMGNLKMMSDYYTYARRTLGDFFDDARKKGLGKAWDDMTAWGDMRMSPTDLSDVGGYTFLINGMTPDRNWSALFRPGERVRLRFVNASAMSIYDVRIPGLKLTIVSADGRPVEPVTVDEFRFGVAETYDAVVTPQEDIAYTITAEPIDRTGFALATLAPREGMRGPAPQKRPRALLTMADMNMENMMRDMPDMDMADPDTRISGWAKAGTPPGDRALDYADLRYAGIQKDVRQPDRTVEVRLGGNMERYIWTINGKRFQDSGPMDLRYGERVRLQFINDTMMAHPMHLHGMFVQLENGQPAEKLPDKHTVIVPPGQSYSVLLTADEPGEWAFHCHLLYHMMAGMMNKVVVARLDSSAVPPQARPVEKMKAPRVDHGMEGHSHAH